MRVRSLSLAALGVAVFLAGWALGARELHNPILLPSPAEVLRDLWQMAAGDGSLWADVLASLRRVGTGFLSAGLLAVPLALILGWSGLARAVLLPIVSFLRPIPPVAWIPLAILWFGLGDLPSYFITAVAAFFPVFLSTYRGALGVEAQHINAARCLGAGRWALLRRIYLPAALPSIWTGLRIGLGQSWMAVVTAELIAAQSGLGYRIQLSRLDLDTAGVIVGMCVIGLIGSLMSVLLGWLERLALPWRAAATRH